jgi:hypothetical protein
MAVIDNLIVYYPMDEASGDALDAHSNGYDLADNTAVGAGSGVVSGARDFEASTGQWFDRASNADLQTGDIDFTLQAWVRMESKPANPLPIVQRFQSGQTEYVLEWDNGGDRFRFYVHNGSTFPIVVANNFGAPSTATWYLVHAWHDAANDLIGIAVNAGTADTTATSLGVNSSTATFRYAQNADNYYFDGLMDECAFWKKVLTSAERTWLYNAGAGRSYADIVAEAGGGGGVVIPIVMHHLRQQGIA